mmetsp:Transcript_4075/g.7425  ORF Transcript_4075/g.7425 Transcript_4075/m.7425 type:complete len:212 (-) Transcript_4075:766-1401(-)
MIRHCGPFRVSEFITRGVIRAVMHLNVQNEACMDVQCRWRPPGKGRNQLRRSLQSPLVAEPLAQHSARAGLGSRDGEVDVVPQAVILRLEQCDHLIGQTWAPSLVSNVLKEAPKLHAGIRVKGEELTAHKLWVRYQAPAVLPKGELAAKACAIKLCCKQGSLKVAPHVPLAGKVALRHDAGEEPRGLGHVFRVSLHGAQHQKVLLPIRLQA